MRQSIPPYSNPMKTGNTNLRFSVYPIKGIVLFLCVGLLAACSAKQESKVANADEEFAKIEREYAVFFLSRFPVVATYLGGAAFDESLKEIDGKLRDYSADALKEEDTS